MRKVFSLLLALMLVCSLAVPAFATSGGSVNLRNNRITITPAVRDWTTTDLFGNFKDIMPGDTRTETVTINNLALQYDYVTVYMEAVRHPGEELQTSDPEYGKNLVEMHDFLEKLEITVTSKGKEIYHESPDQEDGLSSPKKLGTIRRGKSMELNVELYWDPDQDYDYNKYANRVGEVDWVFYFEGHNYSDSPKTGDYIIMGAVALMVISAAALMILFVLKRRKNRK